MSENALSEAMKRYREGLASRGVRQIQTNLPDAMVDWIDQISAEKGLNRSSMIEVLCRLGAARLDSALRVTEPETLKAVTEEREMDEPSSDAVRPKNGDSVVAILPPGSGRLSRFLFPFLTERRDAHVLFVSAHGGRPIPDRTGVLLEWRTTAPTQGHRFNPFSPNVMPKDDLRSCRLYVRWLSHVLAPDRGDMDAAFPDSTRQLIEETIWALVEGNDALTLEALAETIEAMPWPPASDMARVVADRRVIDILANTHKGLLPFANRDDKALTSAVEAARDALAPFTTPELRRLTAADDDILGRFDGPPTVVQVLNAGPRAPVSRLATMLVVSAIVRRLRTKPYSDQPPLIIALDDLGSLPRIPGLEEAVTIGHRHAFAVVATAQSFRQIEARYGEAAALSIQAAARVMTTPPTSDELYTF
jgi:Type IV secretion-system coupling protein DNA-binding domain